MFTDLSLGLKKPKVLLFFLFFVVGTTQKLLKEDEGCRLYLYDLLDLNVQADPTVLKCFDGSQL